MLICCFLQIALLHSISAVFDLLLQVLSPVDVAKLAITMTESLPARDPTTQLTQAKLVLLRNIVSSQLFRRNGEDYDLLGAFPSNIMLHSVD